MDENIQNTQLLVRLDSNLASFAGMVNEIKTDIKDIKTILNDTKTDVAVLRSQDLNERLVSLESFKWIIIGGLTVGQVVVGIMVNLALKLIF